MKTGWEVKPLLDVCSKITQGPNPKYDGVEDNMFRVLKTKHLYDVAIKYDEADRISKRLFDEHLKAELQDGDILLAIVGQGSINKCNVFQQSDEARYIFTRALGLIRPMLDCVDPHYVKYFLQSDVGKGMVDSGIGGSSGQQVVTTTHLKKLLIPIPPLEEQKRIVAVLDAAFEGLTRAKENAEANLQNARELFEAGLVSVFSTIEEGCDQKLLKDIALDFGRGKSKHRPRNAPFLYGGPYPFVQTGDVRNSEHLITEYKQTYTDAGLAQSKLWPADTLCITIAANIAETAILSFDACFPDSIIGVVPDPKLTSSRYLEYLLQFFQKRLKARGEGAAQHNINLATFETEYFPFPIVPKQELAIEALDKASAAVQLAEVHYRTKLTDIADLRQSLLQKAFAGELT